MLGLAAEDKEHPSFAHGGAKALEEVEKTRCALLTRTRARACVCVCGWVRGS